MFECWKLTFVHALVCTCIHTYLSFALRVFSMWMKLLLTILILYEKLNQLINISVNLYDSCWCTKSLVMMGVALITVHHKIIRNSLKQKTRVGYDYKAKFKILYYFLKRSMYVCMYY